ncbi:hypothetical protein K8R78_00095 [bacterium]|nr:hypothetical protein [bacterium]
MNKQVTVALVICALAGGAFANPMPVPDTGTTLIIAGVLAAGVITFMLLDAFDTEDEAAETTPERMDFSTEPSPETSVVADDEVRWEPIVGANVDNTDEGRVWAALAERGWERPGRKPFATRSSEYGNEELVVILNDDTPRSIVSVSYTCEGGTEEQLEARYQELIVMYEEGSKGPGLHSGTGPIFGCYWENRGGELISSIEYYPPGEDGPRIELEINYR